MGRESSAKRMAELLGSPAITIQPLGLQQNKRQDMNSWSGLGSVIQHHVFYELVFSSWRGSILCLTAEASKINYRNSQGQNIFFQNIASLPNFSIQPPFSRAQPCHIIQSLFTPLAQFCLSKSADPLNSNFALSIFYFALNQLQDNDYDLFLHKKFRCACS